MTDQDRQLLQAFLRTSFYAFVMRVFSTLNPSAKLLENWHIEAICHHLELVRTGKVKRLIINVPPRSLKSTICSIAFPAFVLGQDPTRRVISVSYGSDLATKLAIDCRTVLQAPWYKAAFSATRLSRNKNTEDEVTTTRHGLRLATSVGGTLTGRGGDLIIIDDPIKAQDAYSESKREVVNDWYDSTLLSRLDDKRTGAIVVVMQRVHENDLTGKLLKGPDKWELLKFPAIVEHDERILVGENKYYYRKAGELLHAEREPSSVLITTRAQVGAELYAAQYQQMPVAPGGNMIKRDWVRRYDQLPPRTSSTFVLQSYDTASKPGEQNDWTVCTTWYVVNGKYLLADVLRGRFDYPTLKTRAFEHAQLHRPSVILIEDSGLGVALASDLSDRRLTALAVKVEYNKQTRMAIQSAKFESGRVYLPQSSSWLEDVESELFAFPASRFDDIVDSISQALAYEIKDSSWNAKSLEGFRNLTESSVWDRQFASLAGRPW